MNTRQIEVVQRLVDRHKAIKEEMSALQEELEAVNESLMEKLEANELETLTLDDKEENTVKVTIVRPTQLKIDEVGLEKALTKSQWSSVTKTVVDKKALEDAVVRGKIDATVVADHTKEVKAKPYLRITG